MVVNTVGHLSEAAFHHPDLTVSYAFVIVKLMNHAAKGVTNKDFELAQKIEQVVQWQPGKGRRRARGHTVGSAFCLYPVRQISRETTRHPFCCTGLRRLYESAP